MPESSRELGIFGGPPAFDQPLHVGRPNIGDRAAFQQRMDRILDERWLTNDGPYVRELEDALAAYTGAQHCVAMCNGTVALEIAIRAAGLDGEVIIPGFTFVATAHALQWQEITPVFCDVDPRTHAIDPRRIESLITPRTTGILGVHLWGGVCDVAEIDVIAKRHGLQAIYDAAHAFACGRDGVAVGNNGRAEVLSFHATKFLNSFEGGAVLTNDSDLADRIRLMRNFGFAGYDNVIYVGTNGKMAEFAAAMALTNLEVLDQFVDANVANFAAYEKGLGDLPGLSLYQPASNDQWNYQYVVIRVDADRAGLTRDQLVEVLWAENVRARRYFAPGVHRMEPYKSYFPHAGMLLPITETLCEEVLVLPTGTAVDPETAAKVCDILAAALDRHALVRQACRGLEWTG